VSTFSGLSTALTSLYANRRAMEVTGQNIANASTEGYSRQRVDMRSIGGATVPGIHAQAPPVGSGVSVEQVHRLNDAFLDNRSRIEHANAEYLGGKQQLLTRVEQVFGEPGDTAIQSQLAEMWNSFGDLTNRPGDPAARTVVLQRASVVVDSVRGAAQSMGSLWQTSREQLDTVVAEINTTAKGVAEMNRVVQVTTASGQPANEVADERDRLVMKLAELTGARGIAREDGSVDVLLGGASLVNGGDARTLEAVGARVMAEQATTPLQMRWTDNNTVAAIPSGKVAATLESLSVTLPDYMGQLDTVAAGLASAVNAQHTAGYDRDGNPGAAFFTGTTADTLQLAISDPDDVAAASTPGGSLAGGNADALADLAKLPDGPDKKYRQMVVDLGVFTQSVNRRTEIQTSVVQQIDTERAGQSGVNIDEEMTNLVAYERAYQAAAKVISTIDDMLDTLINRMGR
jgi:flagellar hook-associated protein 1